MNQPYLSFSFISVLLDTIWKWPSTLLFFIVPLLSHVWLFATPWTHQTSLSLIISQSLSKFMSIASVMPSSQLILWPPLLLPSIFPSIKDFSSESSVHIRWPKYWSFSFSISPFNEYLGLISLKIDWYDLLAVNCKESSPAPQFKGINSLVFCLLYTPTLTTILDHLEDHTDPCCQGNVSAFQHSV